ncbi:hypothetical protein BSLG_003537 [Batrachochytrium salamandrivorans]|nr:hypothetical protein BSLG_003537 [Batrachochytrium salamandrivorans]
MDNPADLKILAELLSAPPFSKSWSAIQLHDTVTPIQLLQCANDVVSHLDQANPQSPHRNIDVRNEIPEDTVARLSEFLRMLKFKAAQTDIDRFSQKMLDLDRSTLLTVLLFLVKDVQTHKKRAYLALFLSIPDIPTEFSHDDGNNAAILKREIQQMEEERQQVINKVTKLRKNVDGMANRDQWLEAAKNLRTEMKTEAEISDRIKEQRLQVTNADKNLSKALQELKETKANLVSSSPEAFFAKMQEENKMNRFLAEESLPKALEETRQKVTHLSSILAEPAMNESDLAAIEKEILESNHIIVQLAERKMAKSSTTDANLALFRQQASIISRKKEGAVQKIAILTEQLGSLNSEWQVKEELMKKSTGTKILKGEEFKRYVSELRGKSTHFKRKKAELSELMAEYGILQRTEEILKTKEAFHQDMIHAVEKKTGIVGFHDTQETLEKVSEKKSGMDEIKGKTLNEISEIIQTLMSTINDKKGMLAPVIQELRQLRQEAQEIDLKCIEKKQIYDAVMIGLEGEINKAEQEIKSSRQDIINDQSKYHYVNSMHRLAEISQDRVYTGGDEMIEAQQKARGFKTYREYYNKKISEHENQLKTLKEQQKEIKARQEPNLKQIAMFKDVCHLLDLKYKHNARVLNGGGQVETGTVTMDRLVL